MSTVAALKEYVAECWAEVERAHDALTSQQTDAAADAFIAAIDAWREAVGQFDAEVFTRLQFQARAYAGVTSSSGGGR